MKIYTKTGDAGKSALYRGRRRFKSDPVFEVLGTLDELNATLGLLSNSRLPEIKNTILDIQNDLFTVGSLVANLDSKETDFVFLEKKVMHLEKTIDNLEDKLPELKNFILPTGTNSAVYLHLARAVCRRLERKLVQYYVSESAVYGKEFMLMYTNRLSDLLFVMARFANNAAGVQDYVWKGLGH